jgi:hypothetical protein
MTLHWLALVSQWQISSACQYVCEQHSLPPGVDAYHSKTADNLSSVVETDLETLKS